MNRVINADYDYLFTVLVLGDECVGKSSLLQRYTKGTFPELGESVPTIGIDFKLKYVRWKGHRVLLQLWDSSGKLKYRSLIQHFIAKMMGVILVLDVTCTDSLAQIGGWIDAIRRDANSETQIILLGNKCDQSLTRIVSKDEMLQYAGQMNVVYMECSCKENLQIHQVFHKVIDLISCKMSEVMAFL